ncbi:MAG: hypothetical protein WCD86_16400 [Ktedonobacteraceae bacterium]
MTRRVHRDDQQRTEKKRSVEMSRRMAQGTLEQASAPLQQSQGGMVLSTA